MGFEPTTSAVTGRRSNQLSHRAKKVCTFKTTHKSSFLIANLIDESRSSRFRLRFISMDLLRKSPCCHKLYSLSKLIHPVY